jgi:hypothetical protein
VTPGGGSAAPRPQNGFRQHPPETTSLKPLQAIPASFPASQLLASPDLAAQDPHTFTSQSSILTMALTLQEEAKQLRKAMKG